MAETIDIANPGDDEAALKAALKILVDSLETVTKTTNYTIVSSDNGRHFNTLGASGAVTFTLPSSAVDFTVGFMVGAAHALNIDAAGTDVIHLAGLETSAGGQVSSDVPYAFLKIECHSTGHWAVTSIIGPWDGVGWSS